MSRLFKVQSLNPTKIPSQLCLHFLFQCLSQVISYFISVQAHINLRVYVTRKHLPLWERKAGPANRLSRHRKGPLNCFHTCSWPKVVPVRCAFLYEQLQKAEYKNVMRLLLTFFNRKQWHPNKRKYGNDRILKDRINDRSLSKECPCPIFGDLFCFLKTGYRQDVMCDVTVGSL